MTGARLEFRWKDQPPGYISESRSPKQFLWPLHYVTTPILIQHYLGHNEYMLRLILGSWSSRTITFRDIISISQSINWNIFESNFLYSEMPPILTLSVVTEPFTAPITEHSLSMIAAIINSLSIVTLTCIHNPSITIIAAIPSDSFSEMEIGRSHRRPTRHTREQTRWLIANKVQQFVSHFALTCKAATQ